MLAVSFLAERIIEIPDRIAVRINFRMRVSITQILVSVVAAVGDVVVLVARTIHGLKVMKSTPGPDRSDRPVNLPVLEPRMTRRTPGQTLHEFVGMIKQVLDALGLGVKGLDVLDLELFDHLEHVARVPFKNGQCGTVAHGTVGAQEVKQVREPFGHDAHVCFWEVAELFAEVAPVPTNDRKVWAEAGVKPARADDGVDLIGRTGVVDDAGRRDALDTLADYLDVGFDQTLQVA